MKTSKNVLKTMVAVAIIVISFINVSFSQTTPTIMIDGMSMMASNVAVAPYWLRAGQTLATGNLVKLISVLEYNIAPAAAGGNDLQFESIISVSTVQTVPANKGWKIESVALDPTASPIMQGIQGPTGATGPAGATGATGPTGPAGPGAAHYIGELYGGGIVVAVWNQSEGGVQHGLISALIDQSVSSTWSNVTSTLIGASAESQTDGQTNTNAIIAQAGHTSSAALICRNYSGGGFNDWYLPANGELLICYAAKAIVNYSLGVTNGFQSARYWSSTETNSTQAWLTDLTQGSTQGANGKSEIYRVRAMRKF